MKQENLRSTLVLQVHDELNFNVLNSEVDAMQRLVAQEMENAIQLRVPLKVDIGVGLNWLEAH